MSKLLDRSKLAKPKERHIDLGPARILARHNPHPRRLGLLLFLNAPMVLAKTTVKAYEEPLEMHTINN